MAIFVGNWLDGSGVPFIPGAYQSREYSPGGVAQLYPIPPKPSPGQIKARQYFMYAAVHYRSLEAYEKQEWEDDGQDRPWTLRSRGSSYLHGPAFFMYARMPRNWAGVGRGPDLPDWGGRRALEIPVADYFPPPGGFSITFQNDLELAGVDDEWVEFFEVNPRFQHLDKPEDFTRTALTFHPFPNGDEFQVVQFPPVYPPHDPPAYVLVRHGRGISIDTWLVECT